MSFGAPQWFWALLSIPFLVAMFVRAERRAAVRLRQFVSERLLPTLARTVDRRRRSLRFALVLLAFAFTITALAQPRWGYTYDDSKRTGLDLILAVDTSRSMLSNDVPPSRLQRVKLAAQDLINELQGDRVGLIAFAGRAFLQAPLTIDYDAAVEAINDLDTNTIPEGGTNISEAIELSTRTFGKSAIGNRALIIFTDGEELSGDASKTAKAAADAGVRVFTVGVGTPEGSLIPINGEGGGTAFVKDSNGQIVKSKLDEKRLKEIAESTSGFYLHLEDGPRTMKQLFTEGLTKMQAGDIDARLSRRPIERYQWPLGTALFFLASSFLMRERKRVRTVAPRGMEPKKPLAMAAILFLLANASFAAAPGLDAYRQDKFPEAYQAFEKTLKDHPQTGVADKIEFDAGAAAYKMKDFGKALNSFSQALLSPDAGLQSRSHYNLGNTLYQRGDTQKKDDEKLKDWTNALQHYEHSLKITPNNKEAKENLEYVKRKIEELKRKKEQQPPPSPSPSPKPEEKKKDDKDQQKDQQQSKQDDQKKQDQQQQDQKDQSGQGDQQKPDKSDDQSQAKNDPGKEKKDEPKANESPSPSPGSDEQSQQKQPGSSPSPSPEAKDGADQSDKKDSPAGDQEKPDQSPTPSDKGNESPSPSPGEGEGPGDSPTPTPGSSPGKKLAGEVKGAGDEKPNQAEQNAQVAEAEPEKDGQMSEKQAELLLQSMKDEERRVQLDERKVSRHVYKDW
ncbi:MAG TPA: VWA domain-containing protein [Chthoniobacterales bacterium]|nr:VWA domain-containing protein [Chthoniobacterales bacterium]